MTSRPIQGFHKGMSINYSPSSVPAPYSMYDSIDFFEQVGKPYTTVYPSNPLTSRHTRVLPPLRHIELAPENFQLSRAVIKVVSSIFDGKVLTTFTPRSLEQARGLADDPNAGLGECINVITDTRLQECSCQVHDRLNYPEVRRAYENTVIDKAMKKIHAQMRHREYFSLNIGVYSPGKLASETILCTRLLKRIFAEGYVGKGHINLSLIDTAYQGILGDGMSEPEFGGAIEDFMKALQCLQKVTDIKMNVRVFERATDFGSESREHTLKYDLFIGSDLGPLEATQTFLSLYGSIRDQDSECILLHSQKAGKENQSVLTTNDSDIVLHRLRNQQAVISSVSRRILRRGVPFSPP